MNNQMENLFSPARLGNRMGAVLLFATLCNTFLYSLRLPFIPESSPLSLMASSTGLYLCLLVFSRLLLGRGLFQGITLKPQTPEQIGFLHALPFVLVGVFVSHFLVCLLGASGLLGFLNANLSSVPSSNSFADFFTAIVYAPILEELIFRGVFLQKLRPYGNLFAVFVTSVLFALLHGITAPLVFISGFFFGVAYLISGNLLVSIALHSLYNLVGCFTSDFSQFLPAYPVKTVYWAGAGLCLVFSIAFFILCLKVPRLKAALESWSCETLKSQYSQEKVSFKDFFRASGMICFYILFSFQIFSILISFSKLL